MKIQITETPAIDPAHGIEAGQEYVAHPVFNLHGHVHVKSPETGMQLCLTPGEWREIDDWTNKKAHYEQAR